MIGDLTQPLCKVPYYDYITDRIKNDTLPFHLTISAWDKEYMKIAIELLKTIKLEKIKLLIDDIKIKNGINNSYVLYLSIKENEKLKLLQKQIYDILPNEKYNPNNFEFHITLDVDKDYEKVLQIKNQLNLKFNRFEVAFSELGLFEVYPANLICITQK